MTRDQFISELASILGVGVSTLRAEAELRSFASWDSMSRMAVLTLIDTDLGVAVPYGFVSDKSTVGEIVAFAEPHFR